MRTSTIAFLTAVATALPVLSAPLRLQDIGPIPVYQIAKSQTIPPNSELSSYVQARESADFLGRRHNALDARTSRHVDDDDDDDDHFTSALGSLIDAGSHIASTVIQAENLRRDGDSVPRRHKITTGNIADIASGFDSITQAGTSIADTIENIKAEQAAIQAAKSMQSRQIMHTPTSPPQSASAPLKQRRKSASHGGRMSSVVARSHHVSSEDVEHLASAFDSLVDAGTSIASTVIQAKQNKRDDDIALILRSLYDDASTATDDNTQYGSEAFSLGSIFSGIGKLVGTVAKHSKDIENVGSAVESVTDAGSTIASVVEQAHQSSQTAQA